VAGRRSGTVPWRGDGVGQDPPVVGSGPASGWLGEQVHSGMRFEFPIRYPPRPLLGTMGNPLFDTGGLGSGHAMKALNNFVAAATFAACAEALLAGQRFGLDPTRMVEILNVSTGRNFHTDLVLLEHVIGGKFASGFQLGLLAKDVRIAADLARDVGLHAPPVHLVSQRFDAARDTLGSARDHAEAIKAWDANGVA